MTSLSKWTRRGEAEASTMCAARSALSSVSMLRVLVHVLLQYSYSTVYMYEYQYDFIPWHTVLSVCISTVLYHSMHLFFYSEYSSIYLSASFCLAGTAVMMCNWFLGG